MRGRVTKARLAVYFDLLERVVMRREKSFLFFTIFLMPHNHGIKNNELRVELISLEITLSLLSLGKLFVVMDEKEYIDFSNVLPDHCL